MTGWAAGAVAAGSAAAVGAGLRSLGPAALDRSAHVGRPVTLAAGPATAVGLLVAVAVAGPVTVLPAIAGAAAAGLVDDLVGTGSASPGAPDDLAGAVTGRAATRGLAGHLGALAAGRVTTGSVKVFVIGCGALLTAALLSRSAPPRRPTVPTAPPTGAWRVLADGALIAGTANLVNLLDLRPGRAGKVAAAAGLALLAPTPRRGTPRRGTVGRGTVGRGTVGRAAEVDGVSLAAAVLGAVASELPRDLAGGWMLGDCGANALGAALGGAVVAGRTPRVRTGWLIVVVGLTVASERVSFSAVIDRVPALAWLDRLGRPTPPPQGSAR